ncbi:MAG: hypothetical protein OXC63_03680 [Aestuariivita sp.]|nr:hypothetical protein [Aestuariivita sp.]
MHLILLPIAALVILAVVALVVGTMCWIGVLGSGLCFTSGAAFGWIFGLIF